MAISRGLGRVLHAIAQADGWSGSVLQLGRQTVYLTKREAAGSFGAVSRFGRFADDTAFFGGLGFEQIGSSDLEAGGGVQHRLDLNSPVPEHMRARFDAVYDGGTMGCVFDVAAGLRAIEDVLKPGGRVIHIAASNGYVDDVLYMISPRLLHDWYSRRGYALEHSLLVEHSRRWMRSHVRTFHYQPGSIDHLFIGDFERGALLSVVVARKPDSVVEALPYLRPANRSGASALLQHPLARRVLPVIRPLLPSRVVRLWPRRMPPSAGRW